jgi:SAM-dependent methyltransferase
MTPEAARNWGREAGLRLKYDADLSRLAAAETPFVRLDLDQETAAYIAASQAARHGPLMTWFHRRLRLFLSDFDINGLLGTYPMHVLSSQQWRTILEPFLDGAGSTGRLLDVGAGRGDATAHLARHFQSTWVTETSKPMLKRLRKQGYTCLEGDICDMPSLHHQFDAVSLLNVLDRCDRPMSLLGAARTALRPGGLLLMALVLPYRPFVYDGGMARAPRERLPISRDEWEIAAVEMVTAALSPLGIKTLALSRVPYLSGGDSTAPLYELDDLIVVGRAQGDVPLIGNSPSDGFF